jgi:Lrp/AsnC family leucine-responsive transcriptional regulator
MQNLDDKDRQILATLQSDASVPAETVGEQIGLSTTSVQRRVKRMLSDRVIVRQSCVLSPERLGFRMKCIVGVELDTERPDVLDQLRAQFDREPRVQQSYYVTGGADFVLVVRAKDMDDYEALTQRLFFENRHVRRFTTSVVMKAHKVGLDVPTEDD